VAASERVPNPSRFLFHSSIGSSEKSALRSAPHTDHLFRSFFEPNPGLLFVSLSSSPAAARSFAISSASSIAASSASGVSGIVSRELIDGDRERSEVGVLGMLDADPNE
jgi:hypothetical protein